MDTHINFLGLTWVISFDSTVWWLLLFNGDLRHRLYRILNSSHMYRAALRYLSSNPDATKRQIVCFSKINFLSEEIVQTPDHHALKYSDCRKAYMCYHF